METNRDRTSFRLKFIGEIADVENDNIDIEVHFPNGERYSATVFTISNIQEIMRRHEKSGECKNGLYFWCVDMIIVRSLTVENISTTVQDLLDSKLFTKVFGKL